MLGNVEYPLLLLNNFYALNYFLTLPPFWKGLPFEIPDFLVIGFGLAILNKIFIVQVKVILIFI